MIMQKYKISPFLILFHFREKSASRLLGLIFLDAFTQLQLHPIINFPPSVSSSFQENGRKRNKNQARMIRKRKC